MAVNPWPLRDAVLKVLDVRRQIAFYIQFGFQLVSESPESAVLRAGEGFRLTLNSVPGLQPRPARSAGLFHFAILVPDRETLGSFIRHASRHKWNFVGAADHLVSEALYFQDPEDNGIEIYADRPREEWRWCENRIEMATLPLNLESLAAPSSESWAGFPSGTRLGHMHLTVANLDTSQKFYEALGLALTANWGPFRFMSFDGYHHHLAINLAAGANAAPVSPAVSGLSGFSLRRDSLPQELSDPSRIRVFPPATGS